MQSELGSLISATLTSFVVLIFIRAAWHKISDFTAFTGFVSDYRLVPEQLVRPLSALIVAAEVLVAALQFISGLGVIGLWIGFGLLAAYAAGMAINIRRGRTSIECGCGGPVQPLTWALVARNIVLFALAAAAALLSPFSLDADGALTAVACGFALWIGFMLIEQILSNFAQAELTR